jgi:hypothetical protein
LPGGGAPLWRWIYQAAVLDDLFDLGAVQGFVLQQTFCDHFEFVAIRQEGPPGKSISVIQQFPHLLIDLLRSRFAVVAGTSVAISVGSARSIPGGHSAIQLLAFTRTAQRCKKLFVRHSAYCPKRENPREGPPLGFRSDFFNFFRNFTPKNP